MVRNLERRVQAGDVALTNEQFEQCRGGNLMLGRILAYLLVANNKVASDLAARSKDIGTNGCGSRRNSFPRLSAGCLSTTLWKRTSRG